MNQRRLAAIKALAADERGDPVTRALAQAKLAAYFKDHPEQKIHPGLRLDPDYVRYRRANPSFKPSR
jgi:hypothetical protein